MEIKNVKIKTRKPYNQKREINREKNDGEGYDGTFDYYEDDGGETSFFLLGEEVIDYDSPIWD